MIRKFLQNYILGDIILKTAEYGLPGPPGPKGDTGSMGLQGPPGICDPTELDKLRAELSELRMVVEQMNNKRPISQSIDILFTIPLEAPDGTPLRGNTSYGKYDYSLEFVTSLDNLKILNSNTALNNTPQYINLEVEGMGKLSIVIIQKLEHKGTNYLFRKELGSLIVIPEQRDYYLTNVDAYSIAYMTDYAEKMGQNTMDPNS